MNYTPVIVPVLSALLSVAAATSACAQETRILFLHKSEGFEHSPIAQKDGEPTYAGRILARLAAENDASFAETKDASLINAENLKNYDLVIFYTQGDLTKPGKDGAPVMGPDGVKDLLAWVKNGGCFMGFHSASDTFHTGPGETLSPYLEMVGAEFTGHGPQFKGVLKVVDPSHPAMVSLPETWAVMEEWYAFDKYVKDKIHVLAILEPGEEGVKTKYPAYAKGAYPIIWCRAYGDGKVYFNGLGHNEAVWDDAAFQKSIVDAASWLLEDYPLASQLEANWDKVMGSEKACTEAKEEAKPKEAGK